MAESISEGTLKQFSKQVGDYVEQDEEIATIETDKIDVAVNAPAAGTIKEFLAKEEDNVTVGQDLVKLELGGEPGQKAETANEEPKAPAPESQPSASETSGQKEESKPKEEPKQESKPTEEPKQESKPEPKKEEPKPQPKQESKPEPKKESKPKESESKMESPYGSREERRIKMNRMRMRIAERLKQSQNTAASLTTFNEVDMSALMEMRKLYKDDILKKTGIKFGFMSAFARAAVLAMKDVPTVNASIEGPGSGDSIVYKDYVDISVAVATEKGLVTPVVRNAESMDMLGIEQSIADLGKKVSCFLPRSHYILLTMSTGTRQQAHHRGHGWRYLHHFQRRRLRLAHGYSDYQPSTNRCPWPPRCEPEACRHQRQSRNPPNDVPRPHLRPQTTGRQGSSHFLGPDQEVDRSKFS